MLDGQFKVTIPGFEEHEYCHKPEYSIQKVSLNEDADETYSRYRPSKITSEVFARQSLAQSSPFYIKNLWPFEHYRIRVRYWNTLFPGRNSKRDGKTKSQYRWSPWHVPSKLMPAPLHFYCADDQKENAKMVLSTVEGFDHKQLCEWIKTKFFGNVFEATEAGDAVNMKQQTSVPLNTLNVLSHDEDQTPSAFDQRRNTSNSKTKTIWCTTHEREEVLPVMLKVIRKCTKLKGADIILREPSSYVTKFLMPVHRKMVANSDDDEQKEVPPPSMKPDPERDALRLSIIEMIRDQGILNKKIDDSISDRELDKILKMRMTQSLMAKKGLRQKEVRTKLFGANATRSTGRLVLEEMDFESVMWRLRQSALLETKHPVRALIDNPYCIYIWVYFRKKPNYHYAVQQSNNNAIIPLRPCLDTSEVHLYYGKYFARSNPLEYDVSFYLCEKNNETNKLAWLKVDGKWVRFDSQKRKHIVIRAYNDGIVAQRQDCVQKLKDMEIWERLDWSKKWGFGNKHGSVLPFFECMLQFCFTNIGRRLPLSACIDVIESMIKMQTGKGKANESLDMITEKVEAQKRSIRSFNNERTWLCLIKFLFHLYWIPFIDRSKDTSLFDHNMRTMDMLQQLLSGEYGPPKRVTHILRTIIQPVAERFIKDIVRAIDETQQDLSRRYQYLLWYNLINSICFNGNYDRPPNMVRDVNAFKFEAEFIRMIRIDVNIHIITRVQRMQPLEKEGFWILCNAMRNANDETKFQIYNKMCCILSVFQSSGYSEALIKCKAEIHLILSGQKRPLEASIGLYHMLQPEKSKDVNALLDVVSDFVLDLDPSRQKNGIYKLVELIQTNKQIARHARLVESIARNTRIHWREELIPYLVPTLKAMTQQNKALREVIFDSFWQKYDLLKVTRFLIGEHGLPIETFNKMIKEHPERISREYFEDWLEIIVDRNVKQTIKLKIAENPPATYKRCLAEGRGETDQLLDILEETLLSAPYDENSDKPLMSNYMNVVCNVIMESFLAVDTMYYNCHDAEIDTLQMINYFYCGYGMHCVDYCHRLMQHESGVKITYCTKLINNFITWWQNVKHHIAEATMDKATIDHLIGPGHVYDVINKTYCDVGGMTNVADDEAIMHNIQNYKMYTTSSPESAVNHFFAHFVPSDASMWDDAIKELKRQLNDISNFQSDVQRKMKTDWSLYAQHRDFLDELLTHSDCAIFQHFCKDSIALSTARMAEPEKMKYQKLDVVDMCLWLESRDWDSEQRSTIRKLQEVFVRHKITGTILEETTITTDSEFTLFFSKFEDIIQLEDNIEEYRGVLQLLFVHLKRSATFKWNRRYSMNTLKLMYTERIKPSWNVFCRQLQDDECRVYDVQKYFQLMPWHIDQTTIREEVSRMVTDSDSQNVDLIRNRIWRATEDVVKCLRCIESLSMLRIVIDGICVFRNVLSGSKRYNGLKMDTKYQSLREALDLVQEFDFYRRYAPVHGNASTSALCAIELLCLNPESTMTMAYLLHFWNNHQNSIGKIKCNHEGLKWLFTLCSHDIFVNELFTMFEDDVQCMDFSLLT